jgi:hypothetical protein
MLMQKKVQLNRRFIQMRLTELGETIATISERSELGQATWYQNRQQSRMELEGRNAGGAGEGIAV